MVSHISITLNIQYASSGEQRLTEGHFIILNEVINISSLNMCAPDNAL